MQPLQNTGQRPDNSWPDLPGQTLSYPAFHGRGMHLAHEPSPQRASAAVSKTSRSSLPWIRVWSPLDRDALRLVLTHSRAPTNSEMLGIPGTGGLFPLVMVQKTVPLPSFVIMSSARYVGVEGYIGRTPLLR